MTTTRKMTNPRPPHHAGHGARAGERGFALVALMAVMFVLALAITAAAPSMRQQSMRELEKEAIARGEEVVEAIAQFTQDMGRLPTSMDELVKGYTPPRAGIKTVYPLRKAAAHDPLSSKGEWKLVHQTDRVFTDFTLEVIKYNGGTPPQSRLYRGFAQFGQQPAGGIINLKTDKDDDDDAPGGEDNAPNASGPFIGVASRSRRKSVLHYYGIERHDQWVFTPVYR